MTENLHHFGVKGMHWGVRKDGTERSRTAKVGIVAGVAVGAAAIAATALVLHKYGGTSVSSVMAPTTLKATDFLTADSKYDNRRAMDAIIKLHNLAPGTKLKDFPEASKALHYKMYGELLSRNLLNLN